MSSGVDN